MALFQLDMCLDKILSAETHVRVYESIVWQRDFKAHQEEDIIVSFCNQKNFKLLCIVLRNDFYGLQTQMTADDSIVAALLNTKWENWVSEWLIN